MAFFILNRLEVSEGGIYRIAENNTDLNNLNIIKSDYKIIEDTQENFQAVKFRTKYPMTHNNVSISYEDLNISFYSERELKNYIENTKYHIDFFLNANLNHPSYNLWKNYKNQINNLNLSNITYPLNKSLEQYFNDLGQPSLNPLQLP
jgi:hypothetical protein